MTKLKQNKKQTKVYSLANLRAILVGQSHIIWNLCKQRIIFALILQA
jgi:hypothetical protein